MTPVPQRDYQEYKRTRAVDVTIQVQLISLKQAKRKCPRS